MNLCISFSFKKPVSFFIVCNLHNVRAATGVMRGPVDFHDTAIIKLQSRQEHEICNTPIKIIAGTQIPCKLPFLLLTSVH